jgi:hypothetical protein
MTDKEKLTDLLMNIPQVNHFEAQVQGMRYVYGCAADFLIANGVTFATDNNVGRWIPVAERLPDKEFWEHQKRFEDEDLEVQVMIKGAMRPTTLFYNAEGEFYEQHSDGQTFYIVTHWAPLMEPPKEDNV